MIKIKRMTEWPKIIKAVKGNGLGKVESSNYYTTSSDTLPFLRSDYKSQILVVTTHQRCLGSEEIICQVKLATSRFKSRKL